MEFNDGTTTPTFRQNYNISALTLLDQERIREADPNKGLCLVTKTSQVPNFCHCIPKQFMKDEKTVCVFNDVFIEFTNIYFRIKSVL